MRDKTNTWIPATLLLCGMVAPLGNLGHAQVLKVRPGLWIESVSSSINGQPFPGMEVTLEPFGPQVVARVKAALKRYGLPANGNPNLQCYTQADFDVAAVIRKTAQYCPSPKVEMTASGVKYQANCQKDGATAMVKGEVRLTNGGMEIISTSQESGKTHGKPFTSDTHSIQKWIGADCNNPPEGIDREWLNLGR